MGIIHVQRERFPVDRKIRFTINLRVNLTILTQPGQEPDQADRLALAWERRVGDVLPAPRDLWWELDHDSNPQGVAEAVIRLLSDFGLPAIEQNSKIETLKQSWLRGIGPGLSAFERLRKLAVLLAHDGPRDELPRVLDELRAVSERLGNRDVVEELIRELPNVPAADTSAAMESMTHERLEPSAPERSSPVTTAGPEIQRLLTPEIQELMEIALDAFATGSPRVLTTRGGIAAALDACGEDELAERVRLVSSEELASILRLVSTYQTSSRDRSTEGGPTLDEEALARAAIEVLTGERRALKSGEDGVGADE